MSVLKYVTYLGLSAAVGSLLYSMFLFFSLGFSGTSYMLVADDLRLINQLEFVLSTLGVIVVLWLFLEKITEKDKERRNKEVAFVGDVKGYLDKKDKRQQ